MVACLFALAGTTLAAPEPISTPEMQRVYKEVKTPYKYGIVIAPGPGEMVDCPSVYRFGNMWYMLYVAIQDKVGYHFYCAVGDQGRAIALATSKDLRHVRPPAGPRP
jgi:hypothetical protein